MSGRARAGFGFPLPKSRLTVNLGSFFTSPLLTDLVYSIFCILVSLPLAPPTDLPDNRSHDEELYFGRDRFAETSGIVCTTDSSDMIKDLWKEMTLMVSFLMILQPDAHSAADLRFHSLFRRSLPSTTLSVS